MSDPWFYERTKDGWEIRDENRLLVAFVPDVQHEREEDARRIAERSRLRPRAGAVRAAACPRPSETKDLTDGA